MNLRFKAPSVEGYFMVQPSIAFNHVLIYVVNVERALKFYRDLLGFQLLEQSQDYARLRSTRGDSTVGLHRLSGHATSLPAQEGIRLYFEVEASNQVDQFCRELASQGIEFDQMPQDMPWGWRHAYLHDPDGHEISIFWAGEQRFQESPSL